MRRVAHFFKKLHLIIGVVMLLAVNAAAASGAQLHVPLVEKGAAGDVRVLPVTVDKVVKLAGIKLVLAYDEKVLKFVGAAKTPFTANMLHVVNDRNPGRLIIVMASARGFTAENAELVKLSFELLKPVTKEDRVSLQLTAAELMGDDLKKIEVKFSTREEVKKE